VGIQFNQFISYGDNAVFKFQLLFSDYLRISSTSILDVSLHVKLQRLTHQKAAAQRRTFYSDERGAVIG
jgi:hypothetical protein